MRLLVVDDDSFFRELLKRSLAVSYDVVTANDGEEAWEILRQPDCPSLAIVDWVMPRMNGPQLCRLIRGSPNHSSMYLIILTAKNTPADVVSGLRAGADDYVTKPFNIEELKARVRVGVRLIEMQAILAKQAVTLGNSLSRERQLLDLLPLCPSCRQVRIDSHYWPRLEEFLKASAPTSPPGGRCCRCTEHAAAPEFQLMDGMSEDKVEPLPE